MSRTLTLSLSIVAGLVIVAAVTLPTKAAEQDPFTTRRISPQVTLFTGGGRNAVLLERGSRHLLIDTKSGPAGRALAKMVQDQGNGSGKPLTHLVLTSTRGEEVECLRALAGTAGSDGLVLVVTEATWQRLAADHTVGPKTPVPTGWTFDRTLTLSEHGQTLRLLATGPATTDGDLVVFLPEENLLLTGDLVLQGRHPNHVPELGGSLRGWLAALRQIHALYGSIAGLQVVPGHGPGGGSELLEQQIEYLDQVLNLMGDAFERGLTLDEAIAMAEPLRDRHAGLAGGDHFGALLQAAYREIARG